MVGLNTFAGESINLRSRLPVLEGIHFGGGGESFSHPRLMDMLDTVKNRRLWAEIITNGSLLSEEIIMKLVK